VQNFYQLLSLEVTATADEIKKAFRNEIARYHPDKVQHLGKEFQEMAATRAAQLTEAYRTLMNPELRSEYDQLCGAAGATVPPPPAESRPSPSPQAPPTEPAASRAEPTPSAAPRSRFAKEQATRDQYVRKATLARLRQVLAVEYGNLTEVTTRGFDFDCTARAKKLFGRGSRQRFAVKFVPRVDRGEIQDVWAAAEKAGGQMCVFLMGNGLAPTRELAEAISDMRQKSRGGGVCLIPVDVRDWSAHMPADAPQPCKSVIQKLREPAGV
jgi:curved DNA-binding protein CbpA